MEPTQLGGYQLRDVLGEGGMGKVYRAHDPTLDRPAAVKVIRAKALSPEGKERFLREARACSRINHPHIITVYAAGEEVGVPYMAMELIRGRTLREVVEEGPIDWRTALRWMIDLLDALARLHDEGIVHRDLKPENVMITEEGVPKLMDFGVAHQQSMQTLTQDGTTLGTVPYMSPEQVMGRKLDARSDLFSIATILHEMLTGMHPFRGEHPMAVMYSIQNETPKQIRLHSQDYPAGLQDALDRAFAKEPDKRWTDASGFRDALSGLLPEGAGGAAAAALAKRRTRAVMAAAGVFAAAVVVVLALVVWQSVRARANRSAAIQHNQQGELLFSSDDVNGAERELREAIIADEKYPVARHNLGIVMLARRDTVEAESHFRQAAELDARYAAPRFMQGVIAEAGGDAERATRLYGDAIAADSTFYHGYSNLAALLMDEGRLDEARTLLDRGLTHTPTLARDRAVYAHLLRKRATVAESTGDAADARRFHQRADEILPEDG
ncbi:MAG: protein kinase [Candidatus Krumholzibacteria bacterium]|nr:protein kinase [Candidatus Krumholzibacteria bacterium]